MAQEQSWISNKEDQSQPPKEEILISENSSRGGQRGGRSNREEHKATVAEKAEELQPDLKEENSNWFAETKKDPPARGEGRGNRGNRDYNQGERRDNQEGGGQSRGRGNRQGQEGGGGGYQNRNYNRNYGGGDRGDRNGGHRNGGDGNGGDRNGGENHWRRNNEEPTERGGDYRRGGDGYRGRGRGNFRNYNNERNNERPAEVKQVKPEIIPNQRKSCPQLVLYIFSAKFSLTLRKLQDFKCKLLIVPFKTSKLQLYPGNLIKQSKANYREKIEAKEKKGELKNKGDVYFQKAHQICNFQALAFLKVDESDIQGSFREGFNQIFLGINNITEGDFSSVVFCISKEIDQPKAAIQSIVRNMQQTQKVKNFFISTSNPEYFIKCIQGFKDQMVEYISQNELYLE